MKIEINKPEFLKSWQMAERAGSLKSAISSLGGVLVSAASDKIYLSATDLRTSVKCEAKGITSLSGDGLETGAVFPIKILGELFKKASADVISVSIEGEKGVFASGRNKTRFVTWRAEDFPNLPQSDSASHFCDISAAELSRLLSEGSIAGSAKDDFPKYLGACLFNITSGTLRVVSTDARRLSISRCPVQADSDAEFLLPVTPLHELSRLLSDVKDTEDNAEPIKVFYDDSLVWFKVGGDNGYIELSVRRVEASFPNYEKILNPNSASSVVVRRDSLISALERIDIVVRSHTRIVVMKLSPGGKMVLSGRAPDTGTAFEEIDAIIDGDPVKAGFNVGFIQEGLKSIISDDVRLSLNGEAGQMNMRRSDTDDFLYMLMPVRLNDADISDDETETDEDTPAS
ncbi:DNA polymerase III subunit beta [Synergistales bacterium]|nr:DNA polymerase III subunit beta [Synergistales bacterium]